MVVVVFFDERLNYSFNLKEEGGRQLTLRTESDSVRERRSSVLTNRRGESSRQTQNRSKHTNRPTVCVDIFDKPSFRHGP